MLHYSFSVSPATQQLLVGLLILWSSLLFGGFAYGKLRRSYLAHHIPALLPASPISIPREMRLGSSLCLTVAAWIWLESARLTSFETFALWFALGASLSCLGDFIVILVRAEHGPFVGLLCFITAHVAYISGMISPITHTMRMAPAASEQPMAFLIPYLAIVWIWILVGMAVWYLRVYRPGDQDAINATPLIYAVILSVTAGLATGLAVQSSNFWLIAAGTILLWFSELVIAPQLLHDESLADEQADRPRRLPSFGDLIWLTYGPGQMLVVFGLALAMMLYSHPFMYGGLY